MRDENEVKHRAFVETIRELAMGGWGRVANNESAVQLLTKNGWGVTEAALLELVRRVNQVARAFAADAHPYEGTPNDDDNTPPEHAVPLPGAALGDVYYWWDHDGYYASRAVVVVLAKGGHVRFVHDLPRIDKNGRADLYWSDGDYYRTAAEAILASAPGEADYYSCRLQRVEAAILAARTGAGLTPFLTSWDSDEEGEDDEGEKPALPTHELGGES